MSMAFEEGRRPRKDTEPEPLRPSEGRVPPQDLDAEAAVLSALLLSSEAYDQVADVLRPEHFYSNVNRIVYEAIVTLSQEGAPIDVLQVASWLRDRKRFEQVGAPYLAQLTDATPAVAHVEAHAAIVAEKWRVRRLIQACQTHAAEAYGDYGDAKGLIDRAEQSIFEIARVGERSSLQPVKTAIEGAFDLLSAAQKNGQDGVTGVATRFTELDRKCAGLHKGDLYIVAGRPGMGKTAFVLNVAVNVARPSRFLTDDEVGPYGAGETLEPGHAVAVFSLEMPKEQLAARLLASEAGVDVSDIRSGRIKADGWNRLTDAAARLGKVPLWLDDTPAITLLDLRAKVRRLQAELERGSAEGGTGVAGLPASGGLGLVVIDYLQLMQGRRNAASREQEISELSRGLKQLAKEMQVPVIALSQLNRSVETRTTKDKRPQLSDLRESGAIEQDADAILFIYRDEYYFEDSPDKGIAEIILAKQRNGPTGTIKVKFTAGFTRFDNLEREDYGVDAFDDFDAGVGA